MIKGGCNAATNDETLIRKWWRQHPTAMIGVACGEKSGVWCLDPDAPTDKNPSDGRVNLKALELINTKLPMTHTQLTPGGGKHLIFACRTDRAPVTNREGALKGKHINVRGAGGYFIAAGSINADGVEYVMAEPGDYFSFRPAPDWLHDMIEAKPEQPELLTISQRAAALVRVPEEAMTGNAFTEYANTGTGNGYADSGLRKEADRLAITSIDRNIALNNAAISLGGLVKAGALTETAVIGTLIAASVANGYDKEHGRAATLATIKSGMGAAAARKLPLRDVGAVDLAPDTGNADAAKQAGIPITLYRNFGSTVAKDWLIKGVIAVGDTSSWVGPPASGKSAILTDLAIHLASAADWRDHRLKRQCGVVYFALERASLVKRRLMAHGHRDQRLASDLPIAVAGQIIDLLKPATCKDIIDTICNAETAFGCKVGLIIIDTFSKGIAAGGGDENSAKDQNMTLANLRRVQEATDVHIALIGHTGKDETRGARGSNAHLGDVDMMVQFSGEKDQRIATITKNNDGAEGVLTRYKMELIVLGIDDDGDEITTAIISTDTLASDKEISRAKLNKSQRRAMELLERCINDEGVPAPVSSQMPSGIGRTVTREQWRNCCIDGGLSAGTKDSSDKAFRRAMTDLIDMHRIGTWKELVWIAYEPS